MTGRRKSCKTCKKAAANSLPFVETNIPVVDGFLYQNSDHDENPTPGFSSRGADAISDPATAGIVADAALGRTEPTPGFRKTASRKAAIQASSFAAVARQTAQQTGDVKKQDDNKDGGENIDKNSNCSSGDKKDREDAAGCPDEHASKTAVAVSVTTSGEELIADVLKAQNDALKLGSDLKVDPLDVKIDEKIKERLYKEFNWKGQSYSPDSRVSNKKNKQFKNKSRSYAPFPKMEDADFDEAKDKLYKKVDMIYEELKENSSKTPFKSLGETFNFSKLTFETSHIRDFKKKTLDNYDENNKEQFFVDACNFVAEVGIRECFAKKDELRS